jgi:hypothetical protein
LDKYFLQILADTHLDSIVRMRFATAWIYQGRVTEFQVFRRDLMTAELNVDKGEWIM